MSNCESKNLKYFDINVSFKENKFYLRGVGKESISLEYVPLCYTANEGEHEWLHFTSGQATFTNSNLKCKVEDNDSLDIIYENDSRFVAPEIKFKFRKDNLVEQINTIKNIGDKPLEITGLNAGLIYGLPFKRNDIDRFEISYFVSSWQSECQLRKISFEEAGILISSVHGTASTFRIESQGTHTTGRHFPLVFVRDKLTNKTMYYQINAITNWFIEIGIWASWNGEDCAVFINGGEYDNRIFDSHVILNPGDTLTSTSSFYGVVDGDTYNAIRPLYKTRRSIYESKTLTNSQIFYNDYLNCVWANPDEDTTLKLAKKAKDLGCDYFIMDAGWFANAGEVWDYTLGDWSFKSNRFVDGTLESIVKKVSDLGIKFGLWTEIEAVGCNAQIMKNHESWFLMENGQKIGGGKRTFLDFTNAEVQNYVYDLFKSFKDIGVKYVKNDYNDSIFRARYNGNDRLQESLLAFYDLMVKIQDELGIMIECCSSGAMRSDPTIHKYFYFQSLSDQECFLNIPSIIQGSLYCVLPEKLGIWSIQNPFYFRDFVTYKNYKNLPNYQNTFNDKDNLMFNLVNGMAGVFYFSGFINENNSECDLLIKNGFEAYRNIFDFIKNAYPRFEKKDNHLTLGGYAYLFFDNEDNNESLLYIWKNGGDNELIISDTYSSIEKVFDNYDIEVSIENNKIKIATDKTITAAIYKCKR